MDPFVGEIRIFTGNFAPVGWFLCQGQLLPISSYQTLFAIVGTTYGGNGTTNFQLPNLQGRVVIGVGTSPSAQIYNLGQVGGSEQITLSIGNLPSHTHVATSPAHTHSVTVPAHTHAFDVPPHTHPFSPLCDNNNGPDQTPQGEYPGQGGVYSTGHSQQMGAQTTGPNADYPGTTAQASATSGTSGATTAAVAVQTAGNSLPFPPTPLYQAINYIIAYNGIFPSRG
jgi:microcystin-dependent protein